ncbi:hypothetical protein ACIBH1_47305 [Nonomuraea sp. NPDC050663]|uniref:hypothetical protein n=1 Tax=Nonomuraea sp. NPDC050663 TaxID=3364370 RepID=UPI003798C5A0
MTLSLTAKHGPLMGVVAAATYGLLVVHSLVPRATTVAWARRYPMADAAIGGPLIFCTLALLTSLPLLTCLAIAAAGGLVLMGMVSLLSRWRKG